MQRNRKNKTIESEQPQSEGQEKHLVHEEWHVVQQKQDRVKPTMQVKDRVDINGNERLEKEADAMGAKIMNRRLS